MKMLQEEIEKLKGDFVSQDTFEDIEIIVDYEAYIPNEYIEKNQKIRVYRELVEISDLAQLEGYKEELKDIYGKMPKEALGLFEYIALKFRARKLGIKSAITLEDKSSQIKFDREKVDVDIVFTMLTAGKIKYLNREELIIYNGEIKEFIDLYEEYGRRKNNERV